MTTNNHPITPPPELYKQWEHQPRSLAFEAAYRAGADMELEACVNAIYKHEGEPLCGGTAEWLRNARRPKPPSLKEQSIALLDKIQNNKQMWQLEELDTIRRALEALPND